MPTVLIQNTFDGMVNHAEDAKMLLDITSPLYNVLNDQLALNIQGVSDELFSQVPESVASNIWMKFV